MNLLVTGAYELNGSELAELEAAGYCVTVLPNERILLYMRYNHH